MDSSGYPTDPRVIRALMEATCAQAAWFDETGDTAGALAVLGGGAIGSVKLPTATTAAGGKGATIDLRYSSEAADILAAAGLATRSVRYA
ncbi:hypothetical protein [Mycetocola spongiae]|uniref:hypothetical protein n=1 Tax=Mycetocola spongiae TaxID=2859226 RepID=UPI001CF4E520|nr:hypothetical protein [Mycetocola spongiae]UCR89251.1 hypothetical protein KXZ72_00615 [Mycetocola spongiae]